MADRLFVFVGLLVTFLLLGLLGSIALMRENDRNHEQEENALRERLRKTEDRNEKLKETLEGIQHELTGGLEDVPEPEVLGGQIVFPVHPDDFLFYTSPYGLKVSPFLGIEMQHRGVDIAAVWRAQVVSVADGTVVEHWPPPGTSHPNGWTYRGHAVYGGMVLIDHGWFQTLYAHLHSTRVRTGQEVEAGTVIGRVGDTGKARGNHLHFELHVDGKQVNPLLYVQETLRDWR